MSNTSARFRFEFRLFDWAQGLSKTLTGTRQPFFVGMRSDGSIRRIYFSRPGEPFDSDAKDKLVNAHPIWLRYAPGPEPGSGNLEWFDLEQKHAERWMAGKFGAEDFVDVRASGNRDSWPTSWRVIFG